MKKEQIRNELFKIEVLRQRLMRPQFIALGLTVGQGQPRILKELLFEGSMTQKKLADACLLDVTTMSRTLDRMEQAGLLVRESNPDCRRSWLIALTDKGTDIAKRYSRYLKKRIKFIAVIFQRKKRSSFSYCFKSRGQYFPKLQIKTSFMAVLIFVAGRL